jgi:hypothetical protein
LGPDFDSIYTMSDTSRFNAVISVLINSSKEHMFNLDDAGKWYWEAYNRYDDDFLRSFDYAVGILIHTTKDFDYAVWSSRPEVRRAWILYHNEMVKIRVDEIMSNPSSREIITLQPETRMRLGLDQHYKNSREREREDRRRAPKCDALKGFVKSKQ